MAKVLAASPECVAVYRKLRAAWYRLRSLRALCAAIDHAAGATSPSFGRWQAAEPLEQEIGYPSDNALVDAWSSALLALERNHATPLPASEAGNNGKRAARQPRRNRYPRRHPEPGLRIYVMGIERRRTRDMIGIGMRAAVAALRFAMEQVIR